MSVTLREIATLVEGQLHGDGDIRITGAAPISDAGSGDITLVDDAKRLGRLENCRGAAVVVPIGTSVEHLPHICVANVHEAFERIVRHFRPTRERLDMGLSPEALVSPSAKIGRGVNVHPRAIIGDDVQIGDGCEIHSGTCIMAGCRLAENVVVFPNVVLYENTVIGPRSIIHAGAVIGAYGFGYETEEGRHQLSAQLGNVEIGADVEIGACSTIDRGTYGPTVIGEGTKIDNQVMIAHNCRIGRHNILCSQVGIAGSCTTGDYVVMAGQVGIADHLHIGHQATVAAQAGVMNDIPDGTTYFGSPARPHRQQMLMFAAFDKLPEIRKQVRTLQKQVDALLERFNWPSKKDAA